MENQVSQRKFSGSAGRPNPVDVHVGFRLKTRRVMVGLSQEKVAEACQITFQQIQKYRVLGANRVSASRLYELAKILEVEVSYFFEDLDPTGQPIQNAKDLSKVIAMYSGMSPEMQNRAFEMMRALAA